MKRLTIEEFSEFIEERGVETSKGFELLDSLLKNISLSTIAIRILHFEEKLLTGWIVEFDIRFKAPAKEEIYKWSVYPINHLEFGKLNVWIRYRFGAYLEMDEWIEYYKAYGYGVTCLESEWNMHSLN